MAGEHPLRTLPRRKGAGHSDTGVEMLPSPASSSPRAHGKGLLSLEASGEGFEATSFGRTSSEAPHFMYRTSHHLGWPHKLGVWEIAPNKDRG